MAIIFALQQETPVYFKTVSRIGICLPSPLPLPKCQLCLGYVSSCDYNESCVLLGTIYHTGFSDAVCQARKKNMKPYHHGVY